MQDADADTFLQTSVDRDRYAIAEGSHARSTLPLLQDLDELLLEFVRVAFDQDLVIHHALLQIGNPLLRFLDHLRPEHPSGVRTDKKQFLAMLDEEVLLENELFLLTVKALMNRLQMIADQGEACEEHGCENGWGSTRTGLTLDARTDDLERCILLRRGLGEPTQLP